MKNLLQTILIISTILFSSSTTAYASDKQITTATTAYADEYYLETIITDAASDNNAISLLSTVQTTSKTKTTYIKDGNGSTVWYVSITATFVYDGNMSQCVSCSHNASTYSSAWTIKSCSSTNSGSSATAYATATYTGASGISKDYSQTVTIHCSPSGVVS